MLIMTCFAFAGIKKPGVFPKDKVFKVGSRATFCCVLSEGDVFNGMSMYSSANMNTTKISNQIYALTADLNQASTSSCTDVYCKRNKYTAGACAYIDCKYDLVLC